MSKTIVARAMVEIASASMISSENRRLPRRHFPLNDKTSG
jgi:hypothetical protein